MERKKVHAGVCDSLNRPVPQPFSDIDHQQWQNVIVQQKIIPPRNHSTCT